MIVENQTEMKLLKSLLGLKIEEFEVWKNELQTSHQMLKYDFQNETEKMKVVLEEKEEENQVLKNQVTDLQTSHEKF